MDKEREREREKKKRKRRNRIRATEMYGSDSVIARFVSDLWEYTLCWLCLTGIVKELEKWILVWFLFQKPIGPIKEKKRSTGKTIRYIRREIKKIEKKEKKKLHTKPI